MIQASACLVGKQVVTALQHTLPLGNLKKKISFDPLLGLVCRNLKNYTRRWLNFINYRLSDNFNLIYIDNKSEKPFFKTVFDYINHKINKKR